MSERRLIVNADDFGLSPGVNRGIVQAFREGIVSSTTLLGNQEHFDDAVGLAREHPDLPVGVHLTLLWGPPAAPPAQVPSLVDASGKLPQGLGTLVRRYAIGRLRHEEMVAEFSAQIDRVVAAGIRPTHADSHKHVHALPGVLAALLEAIRRFEIDRVRLPLEVEHGHRRGGAGGVKRRLLLLAGGRARRRLESAGARSTDHFRGLEDMDNLDPDALVYLLRQAREGTTELMCHPGFEDAPAARYSNAPHRRERELRSLTDPRVVAEVSSGAIRLISWRDL